MILNEFELYEWKQLYFIFVGCFITILGIFYKLMTLEVGGIDIDSETKDENENLVNRREKLESIDSNSIYCHHIDNSPYDSQKASM